MVDLANILAAIVGANRVNDEELRFRSDIATPTGIDQNGLDTFQVGRPPEQQQQAQPQASTAEPESGGGFNAKQLLELLPIFAASAELFNPFAKGGGPVSLGSKIGDALSSGLDTQKSISGIRALEAKTRATATAKKAKLQRKTADELVDGKRMSVTRVFNPDTGESEIVRVIPSTSALRTVSGVDAEGNITGGVLDLDAAMQQSKDAFTPLFGKGQKGALNAKQKQERDVEIQVTGNLMNDLDEMIKLTNDNPLVIGAAGAVSRGLEAARGTFDPKFVGEAQRFDLLRKRVTAGITAEILSESRGISNEERKLVADIIKGGGFTDTAGITIEAANAVKKVLRERNDLLSGVVTVRSNKEANALDPGTRFRLPDGRLGVR